MLWHQDGAYWPLEPMRAVTLRLAVILRAGDVSIHHPNIIHGSNANVSARRRCGLAIRYISTTTRIVVEGPSLAPAVIDGVWPGAFVLRGIDHGANDYNPHPAYIEGVHMPFRDSERRAA